VWLATGTPGVDFVKGEVYSKKKIMKLKYKDEDGKDAEILFDECLKMTDKYVK
jgi:hypothetical protein